jgi:hypothetical protein
MFRPLLAVALFAFATAVPAQVAGTPPQTSPAASQPATAAPQPSATPGKRQAPKPAKDAAPGGGPDKVWVNLNSSVYHCYGDRYYGKTANGRYMTEAAAKSAGAKGAGGKTCSAAK